MQGSEVPLNVPNAKYYSMSHMLGITQDKRGRSPIKDVCGKWIPLMSTCLEKALSGLEFIKRNGNQLR